MRRSAGVLGSCVDRRVRLTRAISNRRVCPASTPGLDTAFAKEAAIAMRGTDR